MHELLSYLLVDNNEHENTDEGIEDAIEFNEYESTLLVNSTSDIRKLMSNPEKGKPSPTIAKMVISNMK